MALARRKRDGALVVARDDDQKFGLRELLAVEKPSIAEVVVTVAATAAVVPAVLGYLALGVMARTIRDVTRALPSLRGAVTGPWSKWTGSLPSLKKAAERARGVAPTRTG